MSSTFGNILRLTTFGESHGPVVGGVLDGFPAGMAVDFDAVQRFVDRRKPSGSYATARHEVDTVTFLSGIYNGKTLGTPIAFTIPNADVNSAHYEALEHVYRPSHADYVYDAKYGIRDHRGGGRASARETLPRVVAGALAMQALAMHGAEIEAFVSSIGDAVEEAAMQQAMQQAGSNGDSLGGSVTCVIKGVPAGLGEPTALKLNAMMANAMFSINAVKSVEVGMGHEGCCKLGSQVVDPFVVNDDGSVGVAANNSGGIQGGISNGADIVLKVWFKPVPTIMREVMTVNDRHEPVTFTATGRHDSCFVPRAVPVVEAMAALTMLDAWLLRRANFMS